MNVGHEAAPVEEHVGGGQIRAPADAVPQQRRAPQFDVDHQPAIQPDEDRQLDEHHQAAAQRVVVVLPEQFLLGLGSGFEVLLVLLLEPS